MSKGFSIKDTRHLGLVEVEIDNSGRVVLAMNPPGGKRTEVIMSPEDAYGLGKGIVDGAYQAQSGGGTKAPPPACPLCGASLDVPHG